MSSVTLQLSNILRNTQKLLVLCSDLQEENALLKSELQTVKTALDVSLGQNMQLEKNVKALAVARTLEEVAVDKEVINEKILDTKQKIDDFVQEIDKCIELLK